VFFGTAVAGNSLGATEAGVASSIDGSLFALWSGGVLTLIGVALALWRYPELWRSTGYDVVDYDDDGVAMSEAAG
jgi:tetrahydromethanopterin S-methyltransferase subunit E